ncbi:MAG TPA: lysophospholipid acyltransferase family protein [Acidimicrobiia bacterium]
MNDRTSLRRLITVPGVVIAFVVVSLGLPLLLAAGLLVDLARWVVSRRPAMAARLVAFLWVYLLGEMWALPALAVAAMAGGRRSTESTYSLQGAWTWWNFEAMRAIFGLSFSVEGSDAITPPPIILLSRHASIVDTLLPAVFVTRAHRIRLRYVLKKELLVDPALDIAGNRLPNHFVDRGPGGTEPETAAIRSLAQGMAPTEGVMIYPEGTRYSEEKRARYTAPLVRKGGVIAELASCLERVLPPRPGGTLALLDATTADVVVLAHRGLEGFARVKDIWSGGLVGSRVELRFWRVARAEVPDTRSDRVEWLFRLWNEIDDWVGEKSHVGELDG